MLLALFTKQLNLFMLIYYWRIQIPQKVKKKSVFLTTKGRHEKILTQSGLKKADQPPLDNY